MSKSKNIYKHLYLTVQKKGMINLSYIYISYKIYIFHINIYYLNDLNKLLRIDIMNVNVNYTTQNELLLNNLMLFYKDEDNLTRMLKIITGESKISLRIVDWFATNYAKKYYTLYTINTNGYSRRFKVYFDYKLKLKAYSKKRFDPFCRWDRISIPYKNSTCIETTIGQLNFFKWAIENEVIDYIEDNYDIIEKDMNSRNSTSKRKETIVDNSKTRKKREELSISATKSIKKEEVEIVVQFH